jgi:hypothetical protein
MQPPAFVDFGKGARGQLLTWNFALVWELFGIQVAKKRTQVEEMMEKINSQNPQGVVCGVPRATCPLFDDKKEQQMFCFYETSHIHNPNGPSKCDVKRHEHASEHVRQ